MTTQISSDRFLWNGNHGVIEASEMPSTGWRTGFDVVSERTGAKILFLLIDEIRSDACDNEIDGWQYSSVVGQFGITIYSD